MRPDKLPVWATSGSAVVTEPSEAKKELGWISAESPPASYFNYWQNNVYEYMRYLSIENTILKLELIAEADISSIADRINTLASLSAGLHVAGGRDKSIHTGITASNWTARTAPATLPVGHDFLKCIWSPSLSRFVMSGADLDGIIYEPAFITSPDGITWTVQNASASDAAYYAAAEGAGLLVFCGHDYAGAAVIETSPDGITWTSRTPIFTSPIRDIVYGGGIFLAVGDNKEIQYSADGITWTAGSTTATGYHLYGVTYHIPTGLFVAVGQDSASGAYILTSPDGITWTVQDCDQKSTYTGYFTHAATDGEVLLLLGTDAGIQYSKDGVVWQANLTKTAPDTLATPLYDGSRWLFTNYDEIWATP